ncbi:MAG: hypothetical protein RR091_11400, partial [Cloacibacillus sp.]
MKNLPQKKKVIYSEGLLADFKTIILKNETPTGNCYIDSKRSRELLDALNKVVEERCFFFDHDLTPSELDDLESGTSILEVEL